EARSETEVAALALPEQVFGRAAGLAVEVQLLRRGRVRGPAGPADPANEPLPDDADDRGGHEERLDAKVEEPRQRAGRVRRVDGREDEVAGERGLDADACRFDVAHLADEDDVGVLAQDRLEPARERHASA